MNIASIYAFFFVFLYIYKVQKKGPHRLAEAFL